MTVTVCPDADAACVELPNSRRCALCPLKLGGDNCDPRGEWGYADYDGPEDRPDSTVTAGVADSQNGSRAGVTKERSDEPHRHAPEGS